MSMGNFMVAPDGVTYCMATSNATARTARTPAVEDESGVGIDHVTVVPTNFDPNAPGGRRE